MLQYKNILSNLYKNLIATYLLSLIACYCYAVFVHHYFYENFETTAINIINPAKDGSNNNIAESSCSSVMRCFFSIISQAFINGSGIGDIINQESFNTNNYNK